MDNNEQYFMSNIKKNDSYIDILNWYRNLYHAENPNTERGIMANAINDLLMGLKYSEEKQVPMAVTYDGCDESDWVYCPRCGEFIGDNEWIYDLFRERKNHVFCEYCGQKLKEK